MKLDIRADHQITAAFLRDYVERRLRGVAERFGAQLSRVAVEVGDANGPRGGIDKYCRINVHVSGVGDVFTHSSDSDVQAAIDRAAARVERAVSRTIVRARPRNAESPRGLSAESAETA